MTTLHRALLATFTLLCFTAIARAAGPEPAHIPADAKVYIHLDTSLLRGSVLLDQFRKEVGPSNPLDQVVQGINNFLGFSLLEDLDGITFYSPTLVKGEGVLLMYGKIDEDAILKRVETLPEHVVQPYGDHKIHTWRDSDRRATDAGVIVSDKLMMWADSFEHLKTALDVVDGKSKANYAPAKNFPKGAMFAAGVTDVPTLFPQPDQWVLRLAQSFEIALSEDKGALTATITAILPNVEQAAQVKQVADGLKAAISLGKDKLPDPNIAPLVAQVKTATEAARTTITLTRPADTAFADLKIIQKAMDGNKKTTATTATPTPTANPNAPAPPPP